MTKVKEGFGSRVVQESVSDSDTSSTASGTSYETLSSDMSPSEEQLVGATVSWECFTEYWWSEKPEDCKHTGRAILTCRPLEERGIFDIGESICKSFTIHSLCDLAHQEIYIHLLAGLLYDQNDLPTVTQGLCTAITPRNFLSESKPFVRKLHKKHNRQCAI